VHVCLSRNGVRSTMMGVFVPPPFFFPLKRIAISFVADFPD